MTDPQVLADRLHQAEAELNDFSLEGLSLGVCSSYFFDSTFYNYFDLTWKTQFSTLLQTLGKSLFKQRFLKNYHDRVYYLKTGRDRHYCTMEQAVRSASTPDANVLIVGPMGHADLYTGGVFFHTGFYSLLKIYAYIQKNKSRINPILEILELTKNQQRSFLLHLSAKLLKALSAKRFLIKQSQLMLLGADFDRGVNACCWFAAAQSLKIKSFTLQHGVINPPVGFAPVHADEIWAWGEMARKQLLKAGVPEHQIRLTGTPIVETLELSTDDKERVMTNLGMNTGRTIVLALSRPVKEDDRKLVQFFQSIREKYGNPDDNFVVKVHPSYPNANYNWIYEEFGLTVLPIGLPYADFINIVDILLAQNSGIAAEVLHYGKKVGILDVLDQIPSNGMELHTWLNVPLLKTSEDFEKLERSSFNSLAIFQRTGLAAKQEIVRTIWQKLK
jgi:hypothetical protein